jgi:prephenate dehydrogenase
MADLAVRPEAERLFALAGTGFRDFTRIAASSPEMWRDIALANREALIDELAAFRGALDVLDAALRETDDATLRELLETACEARRAWSRTRTER